MFIVLIGIGFPSAVINVDWRLLVVFRVARFVGGVRFWFCLLGDGAIFSDAEEKLSSLSESLGAISYRVTPLFALSTASSVCRLIPRGVCIFLVGLPLVLFPVAFAFRSVGRCLFFAAFSCFVSLMGSPVCSSSLSIRCWRAFGFSMSRKLRHDLVLHADLYATKSLSLEGLHGPYTKGLGPNTVPLFFNSLGCFSKVFTHVVCGSYVRNFTCMVFFSSNLLKSWVFVATLSFCVTSSFRFFVFLSVVLCIPLYLTFSLFLASSIRICPCVLLRFAVLKSPL